MGGGIRRFVRLFGGMFDETTDKLLNVQWKYIYL